MAGPNLEVFKFAVYLFFPLSVMVHFGKPEWYTKNVLPYRDRLFPPLEQTTRRVPVDQASVRDALAQIKARNLARRLERERDGK